MQTSTKYLLNHRHPDELSSPPTALTFVVEDALHLHGGPGMGDTEHSAGNQALLCRGAVCGPDQAPVRLVVTALQNLHRLAAAHSQLVAVAGHEVVYHHSQLTATRELRERIITKSRALLYKTVQWI